jgi:hypothetical protein
MIDVTVKVPEERLGEFYELVGTWLSGERRGGGADVASFADPSTTREWANTDDDVALARTVWEQFSPHARAVFSLLMDHPGQKVSGDDLAAALAIPKGKYGIAGVLAWPGRRCAAVGRRPLWKWEAGPAGGSASFWIDKEVADLFKKIR